MGTTIKDSIHYIQNASKSCTIGIDPVHGKVRLDTKDGLSYRRCELGGHLIFLKPGDVQRFEDGSFWRIANRNGEGFWVTCADPAEMEALGVPEEDRKKGGFMDVRFVLKDVSAGVTTRLSSGAPFISGDFDETSARIAVAEAKVDEVAAERDSIRKEAEALRKELAAEKAKRK